MEEEGGPAAEREPSSKCAVGRGREEGTMTIPARSVLAAASSESWLGASSGKGRDL